MCLTAFCWFTPVLSSENLVSPNVLILTACDELKDEVFLNGQRKFPHFLSLNKLSKNPLGLEISGSHSKAKLQTKDDPIE